MKAYKPFSPERLFHIRRLRKARRLFKLTPLFAFEQMKLQYAEYTYADFMEDLRRRSRKKQRLKKSPLVRYGRYQRMEKLLTQYRETGNLDLAQKATQLRRRMTKPYTVLVRLKEASMEYTLSPFIPIEAIEQLVLHLKTCSTEQLATELVQQCRDSHVIG
ncbi:MAG: hypothetical protein J0I32_19965 [Sphingobacteriales bacterium]|nr:hypothetical protein [Sphingobacteriales bacterium]OJV98787.1 MAG: hypothetical protein BGO52_08420 [Sphingobacteriales bacterium 44-61]